MISVQDLTYSYAKFAPVFQNFSWSVGRGERWAVLGPSGCGKTTLLYLLSGLFLPNQGQIWIDDQLLTRPRPHTGLILQDFGLLPWATVWQNAALGVDVRNFYGPDGKHAPLVIQPYEDTDFWLDRLGLLTLANQYPSQLSGGQRQRTAIVRTLVLHPDLLLMDEPFSSLDAPAREGLQQLTIELQAEAALTLVIVTHSIEEAAILGQKILLLQSPPNSACRIIDNPGSSNLDFRQTVDYLEVCRELRRQIENL